MPGHYPDSTWETRPRADAYSKASIQDWIDEVYAATRGNWNDEMREVGR